MTEDPLLVQAIGGMQTQLTSMATNQAAANEALRQNIQKGLSDLQDQERQDVEKLWEAHNELQTMTNRKLTKIQLDAKDTNTEIKLINQTLKQNEEEKKKRKILATELFEHLKDTKVHYNQGFEETYRQRMKRKAPEIGTAVAIAELITMVILALIQKYILG